MKMLATSMRTNEVVVRRTVLAPFVPVAPGPPVSGSTKLDGAFLVKAVLVRMSVTGWPSEAACLRRSS